MLTLPLLLLFQLGSALNYVSVLAPLQLLDLAGVIPWGETAEPICYFASGSEFLTLAWVAVCIVGWYSAFDVLFKRAEGNEQDVSLVALANPLVLGQHLLSMVLSHWPSVQPHRHTWSTLVMIVLTAALSAWYHMGGMYACAQLFGCWDGV
jgi:hypothetical protein